MLRLCCASADLRASNVMELNKKDGSHADSTLEENLSRDAAGREAALSFNGEDMTKAAAKRYAARHSYLLIVLRHCRLVRVAAQA